MRRLGLLLSLGLLGAAPARAAEPALHTALKTELARAQTKLRLKGY